MKKLLLLPWLLVTQCVLSAAVNAQQEAPSAMVRVAQASVQSLAPVTIVPGTVVSRNDAKLAAEVSGRLITVADVGTIAAAGDVVAQIEDTALKLRQTEQQAEVEREHARLKYLESEERRFEKLAKSNLAAVTKLDETRSDRDVSRGDLRVAQSRLAQIEDQLTRTRMTAPFGGIVVERLMMPGERVNPGTNVVRMVDQQHLEVVARAPLEYFSVVRPGQQLLLKTGATSSTGEVRTVVAVGSENTHQFELRLDIESNLFPVGQTLRVSVPTADPRDALVVPRDALVLRPEGIFVFVIAADNTARQLMVTTGIGADTMIEVKGEVHTGDRVVIRGNERLRSGQTVSISES